MKQNLGKLAVLATLTTAIAVPTIASAAWPPYHDHGYYEHRRDERNTWGAIGVGSALLGIAGLATHNSTLAIAGAAGALYSDYRYETDHVRPRYIERRPVYIERRPVYVERYHSWDRNRW